MRELIDNSAPGKLAHISSKLVSSEIHILGTNFRPQTFQMRFETSWTFHSPPKAHWNTGRKSLCTKRRSTHDMFPWRHVALQLILQCFNIFLPTNLVVNVNLYFLNFCLITIHRGQDAGEDNLQYCINSNTRICSIWHKLKHRNAWSAVRTKTQTPKCKILAFTYKTLFHHLRKKVSSSTTSWVCQLQGPRITQNCVSSLLIMTLNCDPNLSMLRIDNPHMKTEKV